jgi:hypothetical protein
MKNYQTEPELSSEALNELTNLCGSGYRQVNRICDDFGDTSWLDEFVEDYLGG